MIPFTTKILAQESRNQKGKSKIHHEGPKNTKVGTIFTSRLPALRDLRGEYSLAPDPEKFNKASSSIGRP